MSMSTSIVGFRPADEKWKKMKKIYDSCEDARIKIPEEVSSFFNYESPGSAGVKVELEEHKCCSKLSVDGEDRFQIDVSQLPKDVTIIRFTNSW